MIDAGLRSNVFRSIIHEDFSSDMFQNDIALLMLESQIKISTKVLPICLPELGVELEGIATVVGFGSTENEKFGSSSLRQVEIPIVANEECFKVDSDFYDKFLNEGNFCAGKSGETKNVCGGDSGKFFIELLHSFKLHCNIFIALFRWWFVCQKRWSVDFERHHIT